MTDFEPTREPRGADPLDGSTEPSALGASASLPAEPKKGKRKGRDKDGEGERVGRFSSKRGNSPWKAVLVAVLVILGLAMIPLVGGSLKKTPKDRVGISYGGGPIEGNHFQRIVQPGHPLFFNGFFDPLYLYPADQQNYIVSKGGGGARPTTKDSVVAPSKDRVQVAYQVAVYYKLNTDKLQKFHEQFGLKYWAFTSDGWKRLIEDTFRQQIENSLQEQTRRNDVADIYGNADKLLSIQNSVQTTLSERLRLAMGDQYFCAPTWEPGKPCGDPTFVIKKVDIPQSVATAFENNRTSAIQIKTKQNEVEQRQQEAKAIEALNQALSQNGPTYALLKAIESGNIKFWVLPQDGNLTLNTSGAAAPTSGN